mgnify:CR=1 FL=1
MKVKIVRSTETWKEKIYLIAIFKGLSLTMKHFFRNLLSSKSIVTIQYPEVKRVISSRWRGRHRLTRRDDGFIKCVACYMCETICPAKCIHIEAAENNDKTVEKFPAIFDIDELRCVFCGLCVEACPVDAIRMDVMDFDLAGYTRDIVFDKEFLMGLTDERAWEKWDVFPPDSKESADAA